LEIFEKSQEERGKNICLHFIVLDSAMGVFSLDFGKENWKCVCRKQGRKATSKAFIRRRLPTSSYNIPPQLVSSQQPRTPQHTLHFHDNKTVQYQE